MACSLAELSTATRAGYRTLITIGMAKTDCANGTSNHELRSQARLPVSVIKYPKPTTTAETPIGIRNMPSKSTPPKSVLPTSLANLRVRSARRKLTKPPTKTDIKVATKRFLKLFTLASKKVMFSKSLVPLPCSKAKLFKLILPAASTNALAITNIRGSKTKNPMVRTTKTKVKRSRPSMCLTFDLCDGSKLSGLLPPQRLAVKASIEKMICKSASSEPCCKSSLCRTAVEIAVSKVLTLPPPRLKTIP